MDSRLQQSSGQPKQQRDSGTNGAGGANLIMNATTSNLNTQTLASPAQSALPSLPSMLYSPSIHQPDSSGRGSGGVDGGNHSGPSSPFNNLSVHPSSPFPPYPSLNQSPALQSQQQIDHYVNSQAQSQPYYSNLNHQPQPFPMDHPSDGMSSARNSDTETHDDPHSNTAKSKEKRKGAGKVKEEKDPGQGNEEDDVKPKRITRVNKACGQCRLKKRRCDGAQPICSVCSVLNEDCSYDDGDRKRGPKRGPRHDNKEAVRTKISDGIQKSLSSLISKCGPDAAREEISRIIFENGFDLNELVQGASHRTGDESSPRKRMRPSEPQSAVSSLTNTPQSIGDGKELPLVQGVDEEMSSRVEVGAAQQEEDEELDPDFLATNDRGDLMHRGSSSGIGLIHRRSNQNHSSPLQKHQQVMQSSNLRASSNAVQNGQDSHPDSHSAGSPSSSGGVGTPRIPPGRTLNTSASGPISIPMAHPPRHGSATPHSSPSRTSSPSRELNGNAGASQHISEGALAHRDHILNSLSSGGGERSRHSSPALRGRAMTPTGSKSGPTTPEVERPREGSSNTSSIPMAGTETGGESLPTAVQSNGMVVVDFEPDPVLTSEEHARLFRYYYQGVHPFWPLLYKPALEAIPVEDLRIRLSPVLLYSIYAIASCVVPGDKRAQEAEALKAGEKNKDHIKGEAEIEKDWEDSSGERYFRCAERYLYDGRLRPDVSAIQACFLLSLYSHGSGELSRAYVFCGLACSMAMDLGLHRFPIHKTSLLYDSVERETRVRLIWHVYILNVMLAAEMGRPVMFRARDCDAPLLNEKEDDEFEKWSDMEEMYGPGSFIKGKTASTSSSNGEREKETAGHRLVHAPSCLNWGVRIFIIVERILSEVHSFRRKATLRKHGNASRILAEIDAELDQWRENLPPHLWLQMPDEGEMEDQAGLGAKKSSTSSEPRKATFEGEPVPSFFALDLWLWTATLLLHRPFIPQEAGLSVNDILSNDSHQKSTKAANAICDRLMDFSASGAPVDRLSTDLGYCLFTASVLFWFNSTLPHEEISRDAKRRFSLCREWLRKLSGTWPAASAHRQLLDGFATIGEGGGEDVEIHAQKSTGDASQSATADRVGLGISNRRKSNVDSNGAVAAWQQQQANQQVHFNLNQGQDSGDQYGFAGSVDALMTSNDSFSDPYQERNSISNPFGSRQSQEQKQQLIEYYARNSLQRGNGFPGSTSQLQGSGEESLRSGSHQMGGQTMNTGWGFDAPASIFDIEHLYWNETASNQPVSNAYAQMANFLPQDGGDLQSAASQGFYSGRRRSFQPPQLPTNNSNNATNGISSIDANVHPYSHPAAEGLMSLASATAARSSSKKDNEMGPPSFPSNGGDSSFQSSPSNIGNQQVTQVAKQNLQQSQSQSQSSPANPNPNRQAGNPSRSSLGSNLNQNQNQAHPDPSANISPFSFQVDNAGWSDIMSILQMPPAFNS